MKILDKIVFSIVLLMVGWIGVYGVGGSIAFFKFNVLSGLFLTDERIVPGGALDQSGLLKVAFVLVLSLAFHLSVLAMRDCVLRDHVARYAFRNRRGGLRRGRFAFNHARREFRLQEMAWTGS